MDAAAVEGNEIAADVLADALAMPQVGQVDEDIGLALGPGCCEARPPRRFGSPTTWYRGALYTALAPSKRVALHRRIAVALEDTGLTEAAICRPRRWPSTTPLRSRPGPPTAS